MRYEFVPLSCFLPLVACSCCLQVNIILGARKDVFERTMAVNGVNFLEEAAQAVGGVRTERLVQCFDCF